MFNHLVESGSHAKDFKRRSRFFLGTLACYGLLFAVLGVGSIYAYNVRLDESSDYEVNFIQFARAETPRAEEHRAAARPAAENNRPQQVAVIREVVKDTPYLNNRPVARADTPLLPDHMPYKIGDYNSIPPTAGAPPGRNTGGDPNGTPDGTGLPVVRDTGETAPPLPVKPAPTPEATPQRPTKISLPSSVLSGKAISKPAPPYPEIAKRVRAAGAVTVQILVDEAGRVVSAQATSGHPLLLNAAVQAAYQARFSPTLLTGQPVKVSGVITYNFVLQ
ncbi:MAG: TonB family protein [Pyrinomonadaceae bacterium]